MNSKDIKAIHDTYSATVGLNTPFIMLTLQRGFSQCAVLEWVKLAQLHIKSLEATNQQMRDIIG